MKGDVIDIIKILGISFSEIIIDIELSEFVINTLELVDDDVVVHIFVQDMDIQIEFDDLLEIDQRKILKTLSILTYN